MSKAMLWVVFWWGLRFGVAGWLIVGAFRSLGGAGLGFFELSIIYGVVQLVLAGIILGYMFSGWMSLPFGSFFGSLFYSSERITAPPADLLHSLRLKILDHYHDSAEQQLRGLLNAYGARAEVYHLLVLNAVACGEEGGAVVAEAYRVLKPRERKRLAVFLEKEPPGCLVAEVRPAPSTARLSFPASRKE